MNTFELTETLFGAYGDVFDASSPNSTKSKIEDSDTHKIEDNSDVRNIEKVNNELSGYS